MTTYLILKKDEPEIIPEPIYDFNCGQPTIQPSTPLTVIFSCIEPFQTPPVEPMRSTFCFPQSTMKYKSLVEIRELKHQWDTFERIENINSIVLNTLANSLPVEATSGFITPAFYQFVNSDEKTAYNLGQLAHTVAYPEVEDFLVPYASKPIPYVSSVISTISGKSYPFLSQSTSTFCSRFLPTLPQLENDVLLRNRNGLNLYVRVSTQLAQFPKSPYKFSSQNEYLSYLEYKRLIC